MVPSLWTREQILLTVLIGGSALMVAALAPHATPLTSQPATARAHRAGRLALALVLIAVAAFFVERGGDPLGVRPDSWSDANVIVSGRNYVQEGLLTYWGAAQHQVVTADNPSDPFFRYTQYPVAANLINGLWHIAGVTSDRVFRLLPAACSVAALLVWFVLYRRLVGEALAVAATIVMATSYGFLAYGDSLHFHAYALLTAAGAALSLVRALEPPCRRRWPWFCSAAVLAFVTAWFTWEYHLWLILFGALYAWLFPCGVRRRYLPLLVLPLVMALALQTAQRRLVDNLARAPTESPARRGGFLQDIYRRTLGFASAVDTPRGVTLLTYPEFLLRRYYCFYGVPAVAAVALVLMIGAPQLRSRADPRHWPAETRTLALLLGAGLGWWFVMLQHTAVHPHTMRHGLAGYALLLVLGWRAAWHAGRTPSAGYLVRVAAVVLAMALCYPQLEGLRMALRLHFETSYAEQRERADVGWAEAVDMASLRDLVPPGAIIFTNHFRLPTMRYWSGRPVYNGALWRYPLDEPARARSMWDLTFNHVCQLYNDKLPRMYYVYRVTVTPLEADLRESPVLRLLLSRTPAEIEPLLQPARAALAEALRQGRSDKSFCPIVGVTGDMFVFDLAPIERTLRRMYSEGGPPTAEDFGPPR